MTENEKILAGLIKGVQSWDDLKPKLSEYNTSITDTTTKTTLAGKLFEIFAKYYFKVDPTQNQLYSDVWLYDEVDSLTKEELGLPVKDKGVDLVLKDRQGRFYVVQCKFKNNEESIVNFGKDKIANTFFWSKKCFGVILFTNVADCTDDIKNEKNFNAIKSDTLLNLDSSFFSSVSNFIELNVPAQTKCHVRREDQKLAIEKVVEHFKINDRGQLILPCGAGKTTTSLWIKEKLKSRSTLVLFPSLALLRQFKTEWAAQRSDDYVYINVCSEKDIDKSKDDSPVTHTYEISGEVTTSADRIKEFLDSEFENKIVFCTYQSSKVIQDALVQLVNFSFDLIICDEAHRTAGGAKQNTFAIIHDEAKIRGRKRLYMTATPRVVSVQLKAKLGQDYALLCDMSNSDIYGTEAFRMSFGEAINDNILVDYKIIGIGVTHKQVKQFIEQRRFVTEEYDLKEIADNYALNLVMEKYSAFHAITFHSKVDFAKEFSKRHNNYFGPDVYSNHVSGKDKTSKRADILRRFKNNNKGVVSNARCLTEGVDVPIIDLIYFCDPKNSKIDIVQASGRALRKDKHGNKTIGYIVVPIFHHIDEDIEKEIEKKPYFQNLIQVIRSLCDQDERLQAEIDEVAFTKGERTSRRIEITYDDNEIEKIITLDGLDKEVKKYLFDQIIEKTRDSWNLMYSKLVEFKHKFKSTNIPRKQTEYNQLRWWVQAQRDNYFKKKLAQNQIDKLNKLGFEWKGEQRREITDRFEIWMQSYRKLQIYFAEHENSDVPARYEKDKSLGPWVVEQRIRYEKGKLSEKQIELLENIKINWDPKNTYPKLIEALIEYKKKYGNVNVPQGKYEHRKIAAKCARTRAIYKTGNTSIKGDIIAKGKGRITKWAIEKLNELGFEWNVGTPDWDERFSELKQYYEINGNTNIKVTENQTLFYWCYRQRKNKKELEQEQIQKLNSIDFVFDLQKTKNEELFLEKVSTLKEYYDTKASGECDVTKETLRKIQKWESAFRVAYRENNLSDEYFEMLSAIDFNFSQENSEEEIWIEYFNELQQYYDQYNSFIIPNEYEFLKLKRWITYQRGLHNKNKLREDRKQKLQGLGYDFTDSYKTVSIKTKENISNTFWDKKIEDLKKYYEASNSFDGIENKDEYKVLYRWIKKINSEFKKGKLQESRFIQLKEMNFDFLYKPIRQKKPKTDNWEKRFEELKEYYNSTSTFYLSMKNPDQKLLASWSRAQKSAYKKGKLQTNRINDLESIGFSFFENYNPKKQITRWKNNEENWNIKYEQYKAYYDKNNTFYIPIPDKENKKLRVWWQTQIAKFRRHKLSSEQIEKFHSIGFRFESTQITKPRIERDIADNNIIEETWNKNYLLLLDYKIKNGNCNVPRSFSNSSLAYWVSQQRTKYNRNQLSEDKIIKLNLLEFNWGKIKGQLEKELWLKSYNKLKVFYDLYGHSSPTIEYGDKQLLQWIMQQRHRGKKGILKQDYYDLLEALKFNWNANPSGGHGKPKDDIWLQHYQKLVLYKNLFSTTNVSQTNKEYKALGKWVNDQRHHYKKGRMSDFRINKLNDIDFVWVAKKTIAATG
ncbi:MAG: Helicase associated domain protein [Bacteroidota bacterium]|nr:Helicase associated domain protein [Bacteroidota bacterium]